MGTNKNGTNVGTWLFSNLQIWTPFSVIVLIVVCGCTFTIIWDSLHGTPIPSIIWGIIGGVLGGTGGISAIMTGVHTANGVANSAAQTAIQAHTDALKELATNDPNTLRNG